MRRMLAVLLVALGCGASAQAQVVADAFQGVVIRGVQNEPDVTASLRCWTARGNPFGYSCGGFGGDPSWTVTACNAKGCHPRQFRVDADGFTIRFRPGRGWLYFINANTALGYSSAIFSR